MTQMNSLLRFALTLAPLLSLLLLSACAPNTAGTDEHGLRPYLAVDLQLPDKLASHSTSQFSITVRRSGQPVTVDQVTFELWPEGQEALRQSMPGVPTGDGRYTATHQLSGEGIYIIRSTVSAGELEARPERRFAVGKDAVQRLAELEAMQAGGNHEEGAASAGHHDH